MSVVTEADVIARLPSLLEEAKRRAVIISDGNDNDLGAIVSMKDYEIVRRAKAEDFLRAMRAFGDDIRARAAKDGITVDELEKMLDRKAS
jgi:hypothetical protein